MPGNILEDGYFGPDRQGLANGIPQSMSVLPGVSTGLDVFSGPGAGNVNGQRGAFAGFFNEVDEHPAFTAETAGSRNALDGIAKAVRKGTPGAVEAYERAMTKLNTQQRLYDVGYSAGLNDVNANDAWKIAVSGLDQNDPGSSWLADRHVQYLAREAIQRGQNVRDLAPAQSMMDSSFSTAYLSSLAGAKSEYAKQMAASSSSNKTLMTEMSLNMKDALSRWESRNQLRSDEMRGRIMAQAGKYLAQAQAVPGFSTFSTDFDRIVSSAARKVGAVSSSEPDVFEQFNNAVGTLGNGFITYYGGPDRDFQAGYGSGSTTAAHSVIENCMKDLFGRNLAAGKSAWDLDDGDEVTALKRDFVDGLAALSPVAARSEGGREMLEQAADEMVKMARNGRIDLSKLATMYSDQSEFEPYDPQLPPETPGVELFRGLADTLVTDNIENRGVFRTGWDFQTKPEYTQAGVSARVDSGISDLVRKTPGVGQLLQENPELARDLKSTLTDYILTTNNVSDPYVAGSENVAEARKALRDRVSVLFLANDLRRMGVDIGDWKPKSTALGKLPTDRPVEGGLPQLATYNPVGFFLRKDFREFRGGDSEMRGDSEKAMNAVYGGLSDRVQAHIRRTWGEHPNTDGMTDQEYSRFTLLNGIAAGLTKMENGGYDPGWYTSSYDDVKLMRARDSRREGEYMLGLSADGSFKLSKVRGFVDGAAARIAQRRRASDTAMASRITSAKDNALHVLVGDLFSDVGNPVLAQKAKLYTEKRLDQVAPGLKGAQRAAWVDHMKWGVLAAMKTASAGRPGAPQDMFDDDTFFQRIDKLTGPMLQRARLESDAVQQRALQSDLLKREEMLKMQNRVNEDKG